MIKFVSMNKKHFFALLALTLSMGFVYLNQTVFAKGGGSADDGDTACKADTYECSDWSACEEGNQARTCTLSFDCENTEDAKPSEARACEATEESSKSTESDEEEIPVSPKEDAAKAAKVSEVNTATQSDTPETEKNVTCTTDDYQCEDWGICEEDGRQRRSCSLKDNCSNSPALPEQERICPGIQCGHLDTLKERVECRLKLSESEAKKEKKILYSPEYCRIEEGAQEKAECINLYWALERCWAMPAGEKRQKCGWEETEMEAFAEKKVTCAGQEVLQQTACYAELKEIVKNWMLFEMYELEFLAESLWEANRVAFEDVVELDLFVEAQKVKIDQNKSIKSWKQIIKETQEEWQLFVNQKVK